MASSNLPMVLNNSNDFASTLRSLFSPNSNANNQILLMRKLFNSQNNQNNNQIPLDDNNGAETFFSKEMFKKLDNMFEKTYSVLEKISDDVRELVKSDEDDKKREEEDFYKEQREEKKEKATEKQTSILEKILKSFKDSFSFGGNDIGGRGLDTKNMPSLIKSIAGTAIGLKLSSMLGAGALFGGTALGGFGAISGAFDAERISGSKDLTGITGAGRILGSSLAGMLSALTFGLLDDREIYKFMTTSIPKYAGQAFDYAKETAINAITVIDKSLQNWLGEEYTTVKKSIIDKFNEFKDVGKNIAKKAFGILSGVTTSAYDYSLDIINWIEGNTTPELGKSKTGAIPKSQQKGQPKDIIKSQPMTAKIGDKISGGTAKTDLLGKVARERSKDANIKKSIGKCYAGVKTTLMKAGLVDHYLSGGKAINAIEEFERLGWDEKTGGLWSTEVEQVRNLPPGYLVVWNKAPNKPNDAGHVAITLGEGREYSDHEQSIESSIRKRGAFGFRIFAPHKKPLAESSDALDSWVWSAIKNAPSAMYKNLKSTLSGENSLYNSDLYKGDQELIKSVMFPSSMNTTETEDTNIKRVVDNSNNAKQPTQITQNVESKPPVSIVYNNSTNNIPQDTSTSLNPFEWTWIKALLPNRKF